MLTVMVSDADHVIKAEIIQALKIIRYHQSFRSCAEDSLMFSVMFPDSKIAQKYAMGKTKLKYVIEFGIAVYIRNFLKIDMARTPYSFAFDETTTAQTKKQLDGYISYVDRNGDIISGTYIGSKFLGHCKSEDLLTNITEMFAEYELSLKDIVSVGMDGCATNLKFLRLLKKEADLVNSGIVDIGTCTLHIVNNAFKYGMAEMKTGFDADAVISDINFFFKLSSARRLVIIWFLLTNF
jgi:hypothetical protein